jgi:hypothetical protein
MFCRCAEQATCTLDKNFKVNKKNLNYCSFGNLLLSSALYKCKVRNLTSFSKRQEKMNEHKNKIYVENYQVSSMIGIRCDAMIRIKRRKNIFARHRLIDG